MRSGSWTRTGAWTARERPGTAVARSHLQGTTLDYNGFMPIVSVRISDPRLHDRLKRAALGRHVGVSGLAEQLIDEGLRMTAHPSVVFRDGPAGRRPALAGGPEIVDVIGAIVGGDVPAGQRKAHAADVLAIPVAMVDAALAYYAEFTDEIDAELAARAEQADRAEAAWRKQQDLLSR